MRKIVIQKKLLRDKFYYDICKVLRSIEEQYLLENQREGKK